MRGFTRLKKLAQGKSDASGWNKHVNKFQKRIANKVLRRMLKDHSAGQRTDLSCRADGVEQNRLHSDCAAIASEINLVGADLQVGPGRS
jgi:hypothetical protein